MKNVFKLDMAAVATTNVTFEAAVTKEGDTYFLTWDHILEFTDGDFIFNASSGTVFELTSCVNDATPNTPWNCLYTFMPSTAPEENTVPIISKQKNMAVENKPSAEKASDISTINDPACSLAQVFYNGRQGSTLGEKVM